MFSVVLHVVKKKWQRRHSIFVLAIECRMHRFPSDHLPSVFVVFYFFRSHNKTLSIVRFSQQTAFPQNAQKHPIKIYFVTLDQFYFVPILYILCANPNENKRQLNLLKTNTVESKKTARVGAISKKRSHVHFRTAQHSACASASETRMLLMTPTKVTNGILRAHTSPTSKQPCTTGARAIITTLIQYNTTTRHAQTIDANETAESYIIHTALLGSGTYFPGKLFFPELKHTSHANLNEHLSLHQSWHRLQITTTRVVEFKPKAAEKRHCQIARLLLL